MADSALKFLLLGSVFVIATCGLIYELIAGTLASYLLGDSVMQFSTVIGVYLFSMGIGSYLSKFVHHRLIGVFIHVEVMIGVIGGSSAALLFALFSRVNSFRILLYALVVIIGTLVGLEIPLLLRILKDRFEFKDLVSKVFTFDYIGALLASLLFPLVLVPHLGLVRSGFLFGILNVGVALLTLQLLKTELRGTSWLKLESWIALAGLAAGFAGSDRLVSWSEASVFPDPVIYAKSSPYQRIVLTRAGEDLRLHLNGNLQFSSRDEYRYHESLVHPALSRSTHPARVLVLGGGDGLAVKEVLRYPAVQTVVVVDLDAAITSLFSTHEMLLELNRRSLLSPKVTVINQDAFTWLETPVEPFDVILVDFPDPSTFSIGKLYSITFFQRLQRVLASDGFVSVQSTSPYVARKSFWCVNQTLQSCGFHTEPYHVYVPSFGDWGFILATRTTQPSKSVLPPGLRFLDEATMAGLFQFSPDVSKVETAVNRLNNQVLVRYFEEEWAGYVH